MSAADTEPHGTRAGRSGDNPTLSANRRTGSDVGNREFTAFSRRIIRAHGRRVADSDPTALADMIALREALDAAIDDAVDGLRAAGFSWTEIAAELGVSRQAARQRWGVAS